MFNQKFYTKEKLDTNQNVTQSGSKIKQTPEMIAIFELFSYLLVDADQKRQLTMDLIRKVVDSGKLKVKLKNQKLEMRMHDTDESSASQLLNGINHIRSEEIDAVNNSESETDAASWRKEASYLALDMLGYIGL